MEVSNLDYGTGSVAMLYIVICVGISLGEVLRAKYLTLTLTPIHPNRNPNLIRANYAEHCRVMVIDMFAVMVY